jgi:anti-sigma28 factor (negative regulator of flagellin synthesis)
MRIDDLNRAPLTQTQGAEKTDQAAGIGTPEKNNIADGNDQADVSQLAQALVTQSPGRQNPARLEDLRLQVQSGKYEVPAQALAASIIDSHLEE